MPRRNKRKTYTPGKTAVFYNETATSNDCKPECAGCAFAGYRGICTTSNGECLKTIPACQKGDGAVSQRGADSIM